MATTSHREIQSDPPTATSRPLDSLSAHDRLSYAAGVLRPGRTGFDYRGILSRSGYNEHQVRMAEITASMLGIAEPEAVEGAEPLSPWLDKRLTAVAPVMTDTRWTYNASEDPSRTSGVKHSFVLESRKPGIVVATELPPPDNILAYKYQNTDKITTNDGLPHVRHLLTQNGGVLLRVAIISPELFESQEADQPVDLSTFVEETHTDLQPPFGNRFMVWARRRSSWETSRPNHSELTHVFVTKPGEPSVQEDWRAEAGHNSDGYAYVVRTVKNPSTRIR